MKSRKIFLTGASGALSSALIKVLESSGDEIAGADVALPPEGNAINFHKLDICEKNAVESLLAEQKPGLVIHTAAETNVDRCELEPERAYSINEQGTASIASVCGRLGIPMVYISTGEVFDGQKNTPYRETDAVNPLNIYAKSKFAGENAVRRELSNFFIVRTGWLFGGGKKDNKFVGKIVNILKKENKISAVNDKFGSPTYINDLAFNIMKLAGSGKYGLYHMCNKGFVSRYDMALKIVEALGRKDVEVTPVSSENFRAPAPRGRSEALENYNLAAAGLDFMPAWDASLGKYIREELVDK